MQINELVHLTYTSLTCTVRCLAGTIRVGDPVRLVSPAAELPVVEGLTISKIEVYANMPVEFIDLGLTARVTATGAIDVAAVRASAAGAAPGELVRLELRLTAP